MSFKGNEGSPISRETAKSWMENYQQSETGKSGKKAHFFGKDGIMKLLQTPECVGIRIYLGLDENKEQQVFLTAVDSEMNDILPADINSAPESGAFILDQSYPCPPYCSRDEI